MARVLIVDDEPSILELLELALSGEGYEVLRAANGHEALEKAYLADLVLLDGMLPGITGWEVCRLLKSRPETRFLPVIMVSAMAQQLDVERGRSAGADGYITKPFDLLEVLEKVSQALKRVAVAGEPALREAAVSG